MLFHEAMGALAVFTIIRSVSLASARAQRQGSQGISQDHRMAHRGNTCAHRWRGRNTAFPMPSFV